VGSTRRKFTPEYKAEAVQFVTSSGQPVAEVARNLGIVEATLGRWVAKARENGEAKEPELDVSERAELARLRKEIQQVKMERDFLKKRRPSSRARTSKVLVYRGTGRGEGIPRFFHVPDAGRVPAGFLPVA
jgi:transposase